MLHDKLTISKHNIFEVDYVLYAMTSHVSNLAHKQSLRIQRM